MVFAELAVSISVVVPVFNGEAELDQCHAALRNSVVAPVEIIVVDDGSTDGAREARGEVLFFLDADGVAQADAVGRVQAAFAEDVTLAALIGAYDDDPAERDFLSQYKNLMHCFVHQTGNEQASTFWSGCGAIRRDVFLAHSGFDEAYSRPAIEDIELGYRLFQGGRRMMMDKHIRVKHLKKWTFWIGAYRGRN